MIEYQELRASLDKGTGREQVARRSSLGLRELFSMAALIVFVTRSVSAEFTYKQYSASSDVWKRGFVFAIAQYSTTVVINGDDPGYPTTRAYTRCLAGATDALLTRQVEAYVARNPS